MYDNEQPKILILSCNTGEGHNSAAKAIEANLNSKNIPCEIKDVLTFKSEKTSKRIAGLYNSAIKKVPKLFGIVFTLGKVYDKLRLPSPVYKANAKYADKLYGYITGNGYNRIICTHLFAMQAMTAVRRKYHLSTACYGVMTDYVIHPFMKDTDLDGYFVPNETVAGQFMKKGFSQDKLFITGIPVHPKFSQPISKREARESLNLPHDRKVIVIMTGGAGCGKVIKLCKKIDRAFDENKLFIVLTGRNDKLKEKFDSLFKNNAKFQAVAFTPNVPLYLKAADCVLSKSGGLSSTEVAVANVPLIHLKAISGLETANLKYFSKTGLSVRANTVREAVYLIGELLSENSCAETMLESQRFYINANATDCITERITGDMGNDTCMANCLNMKGEMTCDDTEAISDVPITSKTEKKRFTVMGVEFVYLYLFGIGIAGLGWLAENVVKIISQGIFDCRFHLLPFISPYALIPFAFQILLGDPDNLAVFGHKLFKKDNKKSKVLSNIICLALICGAVFVGELTIGCMWEALFGVQLWNYSNLPLQINRYAGLIPSIGYGGGAYLIFKFIYKPLLNLIRRKVKFEVAKIICCTLGVLIVLDTLIMAIQIIVLGHAPMYWQVRLR